ncbi:TolC family protein [Planctomicrobium sp. SH664]|uniref:TolC family protein n=1 Tax=Planctomicrobium sp. SH664 TaxID=3448125 RepID=UPI003F5C5184
MNLRQQSADSAPALRRGLTLLLCICFLVQSSGCRPPHGRIQYLTDKRPADYISHVERINYVDVDQPPGSDVSFAVLPRTLRQTEHEEIWDLTLAECIQLALTNSTVIRNAGQFLSPGNPVLSNPDYAPTVYDPAIQETGVLFGQRGVEAALSDFDTQFTTQMLFGRNETVQNNTLSTGLPAGDTLLQETGVFNTSLQKSLATGGIISVSQSWNYMGQNVGTPPQLFPSVYQGTLQMQYRQPLLAGAGVEFTRIAGPVSDNIQGITGVQQGVIIARINNDIALADFERSVQQMVHDVEVSYWQLHSTYKTYAVLVQSRDEALISWRKVDSQLLADTGEGGAHEAELRDIYLEAQGRTEVARDGIYAAEAQLRLMLGLPVNDGRVIRPLDEPVTAEFIPDWSTSLASAFSLRPEIRRQKWNIRSLELQLKAAQNLTRPRLDFVSNAQMNGFGDDLLDQGNGTPSGQFSSAYEDLFSGKQTGWNLGLEFSVPLGRRYAFAQVRTTELRLAKAQAMLGTQEEEISHEVAAAFRDLARTYMMLENAYNRLTTARQRRELVQAQYEANAERYTLDALVRAHQALAQAELTFTTSLGEYNVAIADLYFRTGQTLRVNSIHLLEGPWTDAAYCDANRRYQERQHATPTPVSDMLTLPEPFPQQ